MTTLIEQFEQAKKDVMTLTEKPANDIMLKLYGLNKQATLGDSTEAAPPMFDFIATAKHNAWKKYTGTSKEEAMQQYIDLVQSLLG